MTEEPQDVRAKVTAVFRELAGDRVASLDANRLPVAITSTITSALIVGKSAEAEILSADQIAFHLTDWNADAAFLVAVHLFPERFTAEEIREGVDAFLVHVPQHVIAAARIGGYSTEDIFKQSDDGATG